jgi:antitoxin StbD
MESIRSELSVSVSEFKRNPAQVLREAGSQPVAVLSHNKPSFYMIEPKLYELILERLSDLNLSKLVAERMKLKDKAIEVDIDEI